MNNDFLDEHKSVSMNQSSDTKFGTPQDNNKWCKRMENSRDYLP